VTLETFALWSEIVGAIGVIVSLMYLAFQLKQNNSLATGTAQRELMNSFQETLDRVRTNPVLFQRGLKEFESLTNAEQLEFHMIFNHFVDHLEQPLRMLEKGLETPDNVQVYGDICMSFLREPGGLAIWEKNKPLYFPRSRAYIEARLSDPGDHQAPLSELMPWFAPD
jgi:hypothetical protein